MRKTTNLSHPDEVEEMTVPGDGAAYAVPPGLPEKIPFQKDELYKQPYRYIEPALEIKE